MSRILSIDAETNGLGGTPFAVAAVMTDHDGTPMGRELTLRCPIRGIVDPWVEENVLPALAGLEETSRTLNGMLDAFAEWYVTGPGPWVKTGALIAVTHVRFPVETGLFTRAFTRPGFDIWQGPFPLFDVASMILTTDPSLDPRSVDAYLGLHGITVPCPLSPHHPLYDAWAAERAARHILDNRS